MNFARGLHSARSRDERLKKGIAARDGLDAIAVAKQK
jgi:hypothetical protein